MLPKSSGLPQTVQIPGMEQLGHVDGQDTEVKVSKPMAQGHSKKHQAVEHLEGRFSSAVTARKPCFLLAPTKPEECYCNFCRKPPASCNRTQLYSLLESAREPTQSKNILELFILPE